MFIYVPVLWADGYDRVGSVDLGNLDTSQMRGFMNMLLDHKEPGTTGIYGTMEIHDRHSVKVIVDSDTMTLESSIIVYAYVRVWKDGVIITKPTLLGGWSIYTIIKSLNRTRMDKADQVYDYKIIGVWYKTNDEELAHEISSWLRHVCGLVNCSNMWTEPIIRKHITEDIPSKIMNITSPRVKITMSPNINMDLVSSFIPDEIEESLRGIMEMTSLLDIYNMITKLSNAGKLNVHLYTDDTITNYSEEIAQIYSGRYEKFLLETDDILASYSGNASSDIILHAVRSEKGAANIRDAIYQAQSILWCEWSMQSTTFAIYCDRI